ncbi:MAG: putative flavin-nucleotide-binding protein [Deltaproteobacteria bacterium]|nr:putative flavin-nucleotide-binding protein [Deltaproteobacteria bacterium]
MRRKEFEVVDKRRIEEVLQSAEIGCLAVNGTDGWPRLTAVNYAYDGRILWHGAVAGERVECLKKDPRASFFAVSLQTYLPSHFLYEEDAAGSSVAFKSVAVRGRCQFIEDPEEKCAILNLLMEKYQPEGKYRKLSPKEELYKKVLRATGVFALIPEAMTGKFKFAQQKSEDDRRQIAAKLRERGNPSDLLVADELIKTLAISPGLRGGSHRVDGCTP